MKKGTKTTRPRKDEAQKRASTMLARTVGIDLGDQTSHYCILDEQGEVVRPALLWNDTRSAKAARRRVSTKKARRSCGPQPSTRSPFSSVLR